MNCINLHSVWALCRCPRKLSLGAQTLCMAMLLIAWTTAPARADCPAAPISSPDDMVVSFLATKGVQAASGSLFSSTVKEGMLIYDDTANKLKVCDGTNWVDVGSGGADTLASLSCTSGQIAKYNGTIWACAADGGGAGTTVGFRGTKSSGALSVGFNALASYTEAFDSAANFDPATGVFTAPVAGTYLFTGTVGTGTNPTNYISYLALNGTSATTYGNRFGGTATGPFSSAIAIYKLNAGETVRFGIHSDAASPTHSVVEFSGALIGGGAGADTLSSLSCSANQIPKWSGTAWACAADGGGSGTPNYLLKSMSATMTGVTAGAVVNFNTLRASTGSKITQAGNRITVAPGSYMLSASIRATNITNEAADYGIYDVTNSAYVGTLGSVSEGANTDVPSQTFVSPAVATTYEVRVVGVAGAVDFLGSSYSSFSAFELGGGSDTLTGLSCATNEIPKWNGTAWGCAPDGGSGGGSSQWTDVAGGINYAGGKVGVGTTTPQTQLQVVSTSNVSPRGILSTQYNDGPDAAQMSFQKARGTAGSPTAVQASDVLMAHWAYGWNGTAFSSAAGMRAIAEEAFTSTAGGSYLEFSTAPIGAASPTPKMVLRANGSLGLGTISPAASAVLDVSSTSQGFLPPRMTTVQRDAIASPATGLMIFNTTAAQYQFWTGTAWSGLGSGGGLPTGTIAAFALTTCPSGWTEYVVARGRFLRGIDNGAGNDPSGTRAPGNTQIDELKSHQHYISGFGSGSDINGGPTASSGARPASYLSTATGGAETRPKNVAVLFCQYSGSGGGGGATTLAGLTDVDVSAVANGKALTYNSTTSKWEAVTPSGGSPAPSNGYVQFNNAGVFGGDSNLFWDNTNKRLGIGTVTPEAAVHVSGGATGFGVPSANGVFLNNADSYAKIELAGATGSLIDFTTAGTDTKGRIIYANATNTLSFATNGTANRMVIDGTGNVGIGTTTPASLLTTARDVNGGVGIDILNADTGSAAGTTLLVGSARTGGTYGFLSYYGSGYTPNGARQPRTTLLSGQDTGGLMLAAGNASGEMAFYTGGVGAGFERMRVNSSGNVGIGTSAPDAKLSLLGNYNAVLNIYRNADVASVGPAGADLQFGALNGTTPTIASSIVGVLNNPATSGSLSFFTKTAGTLSERMRIDSSGNVGIGTASPTTKLHVSSTGQTELTISGDGLGYHNGAVVLNAVQGPARGGGIYMHNASDSTEWFSGRPYSLADTFVVSRKAGVGTHDADTATYTRAMFLINNVGNVGIGTTAPARPLTIASTTGQMIRLQDSDSTGNASIGWMEFVDSAGARKGYVGDGSGADSNIDIVSDSGSVRAFAGANVCTYTSGASWSCSSDVRMKQDIQPLVGGLANIMKLQGVSYHWRDASKSGPMHVGLIAQEVEKVYPQVVSENDGMKVLDYSGLIAPLIEAIKELKAENDDLVTALKVANDNDAARDAALEELRDEIEVLKAAR